MVLDEPASISELIEACNTVIREADLPTAPSGDIRSTDEIAACSGLLGVDLDEIERELAPFHLPREARILLGSEFLSPFPVFNNERFSEFRRAMHQSVDYSMLPLPNWVELGAKLRIWSSLEAATAPKWHLDRRGCW
ncbi:MAG: hypothetical protein GY745_08650 [Actinomycetia bacterium]|nr:hypothetical protein [Actinomycetes bacterium]